MGWGALVSLLGNSGGSGGGGGGGGGNNTGAVGNLLGISAGLDARDRKKNERSANEYQRLLRDESIFNFENEKRAQERAQDLAPEMLGDLSTDYLTSGMLMADDRNEIGGAALENLLNASSGYNPVMAANPYMNVLGGDVHAVGQLRDQAQYNTERTLAGWEEAMAELAAEYDDAAEAQGERRDEMRDVYERRIEDDRSQAEKDEAKMIVQTWISSNDAAGAGDVSGFKHRRGGRSGGKVLGANEKAKADAVNRLLERGWSYERIIDWFDNEIQSDKNSGPLYRSFEGT